MNSVPKETKDEFNYLCGLKSAILNEKPLLS